MDDKDLENRFAYHPANEVTALEHQLVRTWIHEIADEFNLRLPEGREKSLAITKLEEAMFWANAAIARGGAE